MAEIRKRPKRPKDTLVLLEPFTDVKFKNLICQKFALSILGHKGI